MGLIVPSTELVVPRVDDPMEDLAALLASWEPEAVQAYIAAQPPEWAAAAEAALARMNLGWRANPAAMAARLTTGSALEIKEWRYVRLLSDGFARAVNGESTRQIWNLPARYGKSTVGSQWGPVWAFDRNPAIRLALTSYGDDLANENAIAVRDALIEHKDVLRCTLKRDRRQRDRFVTNQGGGLIAAGVGSALTGFGADGVVVDDPFKNWQEAHSPARRQLVWNWFRSVVRLRLNTGVSFIIVVMTRWHEEDLTGMLEAAADAGDGEAWEVIRLPALADSADDPIGRELGEVIEPERFDVDAVKARHLSLGSYLTAGMEQQLPSPEEGGEILRAWWRWDDQMPVKADDWVTSWDMKLKDNESGDFVVGQAWARTGGDYWCVDQLRGQYNQATTRAAIALLQVRHPQIKRHLIENTGYGPEVMASLRGASIGYTLSDDIAGLLGMTETERAKVQVILRRGLSGLQPVNPKGSKQVRMRAESPLIEAGNVHLPTDAGWPQALVDEAAAFPNGAHDDQVDALSQALSRLAKGPSSVKATVGRITRAPRPSGRAISTSRVGRGASVRAVTERVRLTRGRE